MVTNQGEWLVSPAAHLSERNPDGFHGDFQRDFGEKLINKISTVSFDTDKKTPPPHTHTHACVERSFLFIVRSSYILSFDQITDL